MKKKQVNDQNAATCRCTEHKEYNATRDCVHIETHIRAHTATHPQTTHTCIHKHTHAYTHLFTYANRFHIHYCELSKITPLRLCSFKYSGTHARTRTYTCTRTYIHTLLLHTPNIDSPYV